MSPDKEQKYKEAQNKQSSVTPKERAALATKSILMQEWFVKRALEVNLKPPTGITFSEEIMEWMVRPDVRSHEVDLFRRLCVGYTMMQEEWKGGHIVVEMTPHLEELLESCLSMRKGVMEEDVNLIKTTFWNTEMTRSTLIKEVANMITDRDYQAAKRWVTSNLHPRQWYSEYKPPKKARGQGVRGPRGVKCFIGHRQIEVNAEKKWGNGE